MHNTKRSLRLVTLLTGLTLVASDALGQESKSDGDGRAYPVIQGGKWGCIHRNGKVIVQPKYDRVGVCREGRLAFNVGGSTWEDEDGWHRFTGGRWGVLLWTGEVLVPPTYLDVKTFREGYLAVRTDEGWGFIDKNGNMVIQPRSANTRNFQEGLCAVEIASNGPVQNATRRWGFIDRNGELVIPAMYDEIGPFCCGLAPTKIGTNWGYINKSGKIVIEPTFRRAFKFTEDGLARVFVKRSGHSSRTVFIDRHGHWKLQPKYGDVGHFSEGLARVRCELGFGFMDVSGNVVIPGKYAQSQSFSEGLAAVYIAERTKAAWGFIDKTGEMVIPPRPRAYCLPFEGGLSRLVVYTDEGEKEGYIDKQGRWVWPPTR